MTLHYLVQLVGVGLVRRRWLNAFLFQCFSFLYCNCFQSKSNLNVAVPVKFAVCYFLFSICSLRGTMAMMVMTYRWFIIMTLLMMTGITESNQGIFRCLEMFGVWMVCEVKNPIVRRGWWKTSSFDICPFIYSIVYVTQWPPVSTLHIRNPGFYFKI